MKTATHSTSPVMHATPHHVKPYQANYRHSRIGFPGVVLKWQETEGVVSDPYVTVSGIIRLWDWASEATRYGHRFDAAKEIARFEKWVMANFAEDPFVQG